MDLLLAFMPGFVLTFVRMTTMVSTMMVFGTTWESRWARLVLALGLSFVVFLRAPHDPVGDQGLIAFGLLGAREVVLGAVMGFSIQTIFMTLRVAGSVLGQEMGFSMSQVMDPTTGASSPVMGRFFETISYLFLLSVDGHHRIFEILAKTYDFIPVGSPFELSAMVQGLIILTGDGLRMAFSLAFPIWGILMIVNGTLLVMSRIVPQVNLMEFSFALRILISISLLSVFMTSSAPFIYNIFDMVFENTMSMLRSMAI
mgnify:CR=1 FL=1